MWKCKRCGEDLEDVFDSCWNCGTSNTGEEITDNSQFTKNKIQMYEMVEQGIVPENYMAEETLEKITAIILTTTNNIDGHMISEYIDVISSEYVIGTGVISELTSGIKDTFGIRSGEFETKLSYAKKVNLNNLKYKAYMEGANAVIGIDIDYVEFSNNRIGVIVNGTAVKIIKK
ncbi:YbjQ family protein [Inediibacterium massiliense]|uniref:YbjQ family protein n=1 Tax=Inediibacterium massiliense TaxID=1658111 RepID=UPI0006B6704D|nr:heavy metal-binding domain-containing protein [Inediibacterium massiliense]